MSTFEELILIGMFCFVILENEVNSCYCFIAGKHLFTLLSNTSVSRIFGRERCKKKIKMKGKKKQNKKTKTKSISSSENRALTIRFASLHYVSYATLILGAKWVFILALISFHVTSLLIKINTGVFLTNTKTMFVDRRNRNPLALLRFVSRNGQHRR